MRAVHNVKFSGKELIDVTFNGNVVGQCKIHNDNTVTFIIDNDDDDVKSLIRGGHISFELVVKK